MQIILDTTILIDFLRGSIKAAQYLQNLTNPTLSIITEAEIYQGAKNKNDLIKWEKLFNNFNILPITEEISILGIGLLRQYRLSHSLHILDALIAATAKNHNLTLKTGNIKHFRFIKDLKIEPW